MRQLITRIDDELHRRLRALAEAEGRSMAAIVREALSSTVDLAGAPTTLARRVAGTGLVLRPPATADPPSTEATLEATRGAGRAASDALRAARDER